MKETALTRIAEFSGFLLGPPLLWVLSYCLMLEPSEMSISLGRSHGTISWRSRYPAYRINEEPIRLIFAPINWIDRNIRPRYWDGEVKYVESGLGFEIEGMDLNGLRESLARDRELD